MDAFDPQRNEGTYKVTDDQVVEVLHRTKRQAIGGYCGLTGVCGERHPS